MEMELIYHPEIDEGRRVIEVPVDSVPQHMRAGWRRESDRPPPEDPAPPSANEPAEAPATAGASAFPEPNDSDPTEPDPSASAPARPRRTTRGSE